jgi:OOP family OmpA-OmpF porin
VSAVVLASCSNYSATPAMKGNPNTEAASMNEAGTAVKTAGTGFTGQLGKEYFSIASARVSSQDWVDADFFARKSIAASKGDVVPPEENKKWAIPMQPNLNTRGDMDKARARLVAALDNGGRDQYPVLAARTQARYDCWLERTETNYRAEFNGKCEREFIAGLSDLEVLLHPPGYVHVYFGNNSAALNAEALQNLREAAAALPKDGTSRLEVIGKADRSGSDRHNQKLSESRAAAVLDALAGDGVPANRVDVKAVGENQLEVVTKDGVREPRNRVVEIGMMVPESSYK